MERVDGPTQGLRLCRLIAEAVKQSPPAARYLEGFERVL